LNGRYWRLALGGACVLALGCATVVGQPPGTVGKQGAEDGARPAFRVLSNGKVEICHREGNGKANRISVAQSALGAHLRHGDTGLLTFYPDADGDGWADS